MEHVLHDNPGLTIALALAVGTIAQSLARHLRVPGIVLLLGAGVLLGPDVLGWIAPDSLGHALEVLIGFAVAIIIFEGGMNLNVKRLRRQALPIRRLLTVGAVVTAVGAGIASWRFMGWDWRYAALFGSLVIVTGPTVITPLLRRVRVSHKVATVLEAEGVLIDAIGAVAAVVVLGVVTSPSGESFALGALHIVQRLAFGVFFGIACGYVLSWLLRFPKVVPEGLENIVTLGAVLAIFQLSNVILAESGITTAAAAGFVVGNVKTRVRRELLEFKEQLTVMMIAMLFVLLAAAVRVEDVRDLGAPGLYTVAALVLLVRPLNVFLSTWNTDLTLREKLFMSWMAPRGIVAAAVASFFAAQLGQHGLEGGTRLQALVFLVIAVTVVLQGLTAGLVARALGLRRGASGYAILGANELGRAMGGLLQEQGQEVVFLDANPINCQHAQDDGFKVVFGNAMEETVLGRARLDEKEACIGLVPNNQVNLLFAQRVAEEFKVPSLFLALRRDEQLISPEMVHKAGAKVLFGRPRDLELWILRLRRGLAAVSRWRLDNKEKIVEDEGERDLRDIPTNLFLPLIVHRGSRHEPHHDGTRLRHGDEVHIALFVELHTEAEEWLETRGWIGVIDEEDEG